MLKEGSKNVTFLFKKTLKIKTNGERLHQLGSVEGSANLFWSITNSPVNT